MNRVDRLMGIVTALQSKKYMTAEAIAAHFSTSVRTVYRDLRAMGEIGVPIGFEAGKGYFITDGYFLPPVSLTMEEANALALLEPLVTRFSDRSTRQHFGTALSKIKMVLGHLQRKNFEQIQAGTAHFIPEQYVHMLPDTGYLSAIQNAIVGKNILRIEYENNNGEHSTREVEPIGLTFYSLNWHLIAWCHLRNDYRDFRTSRIQHLAATMMPFRKTDHMTLEEYLKIMEETLVRETT
ncbi:MAG: YafY family transcriptional regulator [Lewinellaceae bacterium]|nr:YafY family transcriptional regulator [Lewinellaceae bacterium]